jgi:hypothetical protein
MSALGQKRTSGPVQLMSALPPRNRHTRAPGRCGRARPSTDQGGGKRRCSGMSYLGYLGLYSPAAVQVHLLGNNINISI